MKWLKNKWNRTAAALLAGVAAMAVLAGAANSSLHPAPPVLAWWGTLYPKFCFSQIPIRDAEDGSDTEAAPKLKISFWLAKALEW